MVRRARLTAHTADLLPRSAYNLMRRLQPVKSDVTFPLESSGQQQRMTWTKSSLAEPQTPCGGTAVATFVYSPDLVTSQPRRLCSVPERSSRFFEQKRSICGLQHRLTEPAYAGSALAHKADLHRQGVCDHQCSSEWTMRVMRDVRFTRCGHSSRLPLINSSVHAFCTTAFFV